MALQAYLVEPESLVEVGPMLVWISEQVVPPTDLEPTLCRLEKRTLLGKNEAGFDYWQDEELNLDDWSVLDHAWKGLPDVAHVGASQWPRYRAAFDALKQGNPADAPKWELQAGFQDHKGEAAIRRSNVLREHFLNFDRMLATGEIQALTAGRTRATRLEPGVLLSHDFARKYLENAGYSIKVEVPIAVDQPAPVPEAVAPEPGGAADSKPTKAVRQGLHTNTIKAVFATMGPTYWDGKKMVDAFDKNRPQWLMECHVQAGQTGNEPKQSTWEPFELACRLVEGRAGRNSTVPLAIMNRVFTTRAELEPWREKWSEYYESRKALTT